MPQCDVTRRQTNEGSHICLHYGGGCLAHAQNAPLDWFLTTPVQDLLVAYLSIDIHGEAYTPNSVLKRNILVIYSLLLGEL